MPDAQLDRRIRALVVGVVDTSPPPPSFESIRVGSPELALPLRRHRQVGRLGSRRGRAAMVAVVAAVSVIVVAVVAVWLGGPDPGDPDRPSGQGGIYEQPTDPASSWLRIEAGPSLHFGAGEYVVAAGVVEIDYLSRGGSHTLVFEEEEFAGFKLASLGGGQTDTAKVQLEPGQYTIYCDLPGHRAAGEEATITVTPSSPDPAERGTDAA